MSFRDIIHIAALGFDYERIVAPALEGKASRVFLISRVGTDLAEKNFVKIKKDLEKKKVDVFQEKCEHGNLFLLLRKYREIIEKERNSAIYINVSCGTKITAIAGMMACMIFKNVPYSIEPYYAKMKKYASQTRGKTKKRNGEVFQESTGYEGIDILDKYVIPIPEKELVDALAILRNDEKWEMKKKDFLRGLVQQQLIKRDEEYQQRKSRPDGKQREVYSPKEYTTLRQKFIRPLKEKWEAITVDETKGGSIRVLSKGKNILLFLEGFNFRTHSNGRNGKMKL